MWFGCGRTYCPGDAAFRLKLLQREFCNGGKFPSFDTAEDAQGDYVPSWAAYAPWEKARCRQLSVPQIQVLRGVTRALPLRVVVRRRDESDSGPESDGHRELTPRSFAAFYEHYYPEVLRYFVKRTRDGHEANDLTGETFAIAFAKRARFRGTTEGEAAGWLFMIAKVQLLQPYRHGKVERTALDRLQFYQPPATDAEARRVEELIDAKAAKTPLAEALDELSPQQLLVVFRHVLQERSYSEIAQQLGITEVAVRMCYSRARRRMKRNPQLRKLIEGDDDG